MHISRRNDGAGGKGRACTRVVLAAVCLLIWFAEGRAQYIEPGRDFEPGSFRLLSAGVAWRDFAPRSSNSTADSLAIRYTRLMPMLGFRQGPVEIQFGYTTFKQRDASRTALFLGTVVSSEFPLGGSRGSMLSLPLLLAADFTKAEGGGSERESFNIASVGLGAGLHYRLTSRTMEASFMGGAVAHYAIEGFATGTGTGTGFSGAVLFNAVLLFHGVPLGDGLAVGYRFRLQSWAMSDAQFNYRLVSHGPYLGIAF